MKKNISILVVILFSTSLFAQTSVLTLGNAINIAGKQRMLTQRMAKSYLFKSMGMVPEQAQKELNSSMLLFEENLKLLQNSAYNTDIKAKLEKEGELWKSYKSALSTAFGRGSSSFVLTLNTEMLNACDDAVAEYVEYAKTRPSNSEDDGAVGLMVAMNTNISGRLRMLSQRMSLYYVAYYNSLLDENGYKTLKAAGDGISSGFTSVLTSEVNNQEVDDAISQAMIEWNIIKEKCTKDNCIDFQAKTLDPVIMYEQANKIVNKVDRITQAYAKLLE